MIVIFPLLALACFLFHASQNMAVKQSGRAESSKPFPSIAENLTEHSHQGTTCAKRGRYLQLWRVAHVACSLVFLSQKHPQRHSPRKEKKKHGLESFSDVLSILQPEEGVCSRQPSLFTLNKSAPRQQKRRPPRMHIWLRASIPDLHVTRIL
jgi:hypothetical protein